LIVHGIHYTEAVTQSNKIARAIETNSKV